MNLILHDNLAVNEKGHLTIGSVDTLDLARDYGTPLYVLDEDKIRRNCRRYIETVRRVFPEGSQVAYAGKALSIKSIYPIIQEEGLFADVVSQGEIYTALAAGFPGEKMIFHGINKSPDEIDFALENGVGIFVVDGEEELDLLNEKAKAKGKAQDILLRVTVGIDPHTFDAVKTGKIDSQFGLPIDTGQAKALTEKALSKDSLNLLGYHSHIGSQIGEEKPFLDQVEILVGFIKAMKEELGFDLKVLNIGGGFGIRYVEEDAPVDIEGSIEKIAERLKEGCGSKGLDVPRIIMEPGRSIVGDAGITLYTVGRIKEIPEYRTHVVVDGGMTDNPRFALYGARYTVLNAARPEAYPTGVFTIPGRCCESGDRIGEDIPLNDPKVGDVLAVLSTGAYNYSMASNYNRVPRPAMVMVRDGEVRIVVKRETMEDLIKLDQ